MTPVDDTLAGLIRRYPCLFGNRTQALHHALIVLGNGMEWRDGLLVDRVPDSTDCSEAHMRRRATAEEIEQYATIGIEVREEKLTGKCPAEDLRSRSEELATSPAPLDRDPYQPGLRLPIFEMPEDANEHWLSAAREIAAVVAPLWRQPSESELAHENAYTATQRAAAIDLLSQRFAV
ncbi:hypothetical protein [Streptomyces nigrescens]|uniref:hypothetical protein n=1 Tax=Streptomyces nigrescens TaxID=1920 RepID=UPI0036FECB47